MMTHDERHAAYAYIKSVFPHNLIFALACASLDIDSTSSRACERRTGMTAPARHPNEWVEGINATSAQELHDAMCGLRPTERLGPHMGTALHIGPFHTAPPIMPAASIFEMGRVAMDSGIGSWRDFVIDIDLDDYDDVDKGGAVRFCACAGQKTSCRACWIYVKAAHAFVNYRLQARFGIPANMALWVKSGNKGVHCWIGTPRFARIDRLLREATIQQIIDLPASIDEKDDVGTLIDLVLTPFLDSALSDLRFRRVLKKIIADRFGMIAANLPAAVANAADVYTWLDRNGGARSRAEISLHMLRVFTTPRYDKGVLNVSKHCTKVPFSVHSKTVRVSIPIVDIRNSARPPLAHDVVRHPAMIATEIQLFEKWLVQYLGCEKS